MRLTNRRAHPRVCGENIVYGWYAFVDRGSSPRVRGKHRLRMVRIRGPRLIPACAGKTTVTVPMRYVCRAHPRVCGENTVRPSVCVPVRGSSPRVRGKRSPPRPGWRDSGLIPACAGKTRSAHSIFASRRAHPRVCGENPVDTFSGSPSTGSSPRVRGKRARRPGSLAGRGLIPACAGKT